MPTVVTDVHVDTGGAHTLEHWTLADVAAADLMTHLGEDDGDRAHARATDTDDVDPLCRREVDRDVRRIDHAAATRSIRSTSAPLR